MPSKSNNNKNNYTDPELRQEVKEEVQQGDKGGKPGQWSARKAQLTAQEYKSRGGDYTTSKDEQSQSQRSLSQWGAEDWVTKEGSGTAKTDATAADGGARKRYLPRKAWEEMSEGEKEATERKKVEAGEGEGRQFVGNTEGAKRKRGEVHGRVGRGMEGGDGGDDEGDDGEEGEGDGDEKDKEGDGEGKGKGKDAAKGTAKGTTRGKKDVKKDTKVNGGKDKQEEEEQHDGENEDEELDEDDEEYQEEEGEDGEDEENEEDEEEEVEQQVGDDEEAEGDAPDKKKQKTE